MLTNIGMVLTLYWVFYALSTNLGWSLARVLLKKRPYAAILISPVLGITLFCLCSTALMQHLPGVLCGPLGLMLTFMLAGCFFCLPGCNPTWKFFIRCQFPGVLAGMVFLLPLFLAGDVGIFAMNGADFGSYAGWGEYFQAYTLHDAFAYQEPINFTQKAFGNLQHELSSVDGHWRIGNVSLFAALNALLPSEWPTLYTVSIAFFIAQCVLALQLFARVVLLQSLKNAFYLSLLGIFLSTLFWLAASHYVPNVMGLTYTLFLISLSLLTSTLSLGLILTLSVLLGGLILLYPESFAFFPLLLAMQLWIRPRKILTIGITLCAGMAFAYAWTFESFWYCFRHFLSILGYNRPGDFVGIDLFAYPSQGLGFIDYNAILRENTSIVLRVVLAINYIAALCLLVFGLTYRPSVKAKQLQQKMYLTLAVAVGLFFLPICLYFIQYQYLVAWRALLTISPYVWLLLCLAALNAHSTSSVTINKWVKITLVSFGILIVSTSYYRLMFIKNIVVGSTHAAIFGQGFAKSTAYLKKEHQHYDIAFIDYEGSGTIQGGWEFYSQNLPYLFPSHGVGRNEYLSQPLENKRIVIISDRYRKVHELKGFTQTAKLFRGREVFFTEANNVLQPYSSSWIYLKDGGPALVLPGLPGKLLLWLKEDSKACLKMKVESAREPAFLSIGFNEAKPLTIGLKEANKGSFCHQFNKGLNIIKLTPLFLDTKHLSAQQNKMDEILAIPEDKRNEEERALLKIYSHTIKPVNPLSSPTPEDWNTSWNLLTPPDQFPYHPHLVFNNITIEKS